MNRTHSLWVLAIAVALVLPTKAEEPYGQEAAPQANQDKGKQAEHEALRKQITQKLRYAMASVGIDNTAVQDALLQYIREEEQSKRALRNSSRQLAQALKKPENQDKIPALIASHKVEMDSYRSRRELAQKTLDEKIRFSTTPQLEASLILIGVLGDGPPSILANAGGAPQNSQMLPNRGPAGTTVDAMRPNFLLPGTANAVGPSPSTGPGMAPAGFGSRQSPPLNAALAAAPPTEATGENVVADSKDGSRRDTREARGTGSAATSGRSRPLPSSLRGVTVGTVDKKGMDYVEILAEDGTLERYTPRWLGGAQGGFDAKIIQAIGAFGIGDRVTVEWEYAERKRIFSILPAPAPAAKEDNKKQ